MLAQDFWLWHSTMQSAPNWRSELCWCTTISFYFSRREEKCELKGVMRCEKWANVRESYWMCHYRAKNAVLISSLYPHRGAVASQQARWNLPSQSHFQLLFCDTTMFFFLFFFFTLFQRASLKLPIISQICSYWQCMKIVLWTTDSRSLSLSFTPSLHLLTKLMTESPATHCNFTLNLRGTNSTEHPTFQSFLSLFSFFLQFNLSISLYLMLSFPLHLTSCPLFAPFTSSSRSTFLRIT